MTPVDLAGDSAGLIAGLQSGVSAPVRTSASDQVTGVQSPMHIRGAATGNYPGAGPFR